MNTQNNLRSGIGYDAHPLVTGRPLVLGGVIVPLDKGLAGWSDGDCLTHAVIDALLGAAGLGSIGGHFPPGDPQYQNISSLELLRQAQAKLSAQGWRTINIDATVVAVEPKLATYFKPMQIRLSETLGIAVDRVNIKASTSNGLGFAGRGEGIAAYATALIEGKGK